MDTIVVAVGTELPGVDTMEFTVHKDLICETSRFFAAACSKEWVEGQTRRVKLPFMSPEYFHFYVDWVYRREINVTELEEAPSPIGDCTIHPCSRNPPPALWIKSATSVHILCELYILADYLGDRECNNKCMEILKTRVVGCSYLPIQPPTIDFVTQYAFPTSGLFRWTVDAVAYLAPTMPPADVSLLMKELPASFTEALLLKALCTNVGSRYKSTGKAYLK